MSNIGFYSPSYKRHDKVITHKIFPELKYCVHEFEKNNYLNSGFEIFEMPDNVSGNMARVRNYILENTPEKIIVMLDDDISKFQWVEDHAENRFRRELKTGEMLRTIHNGVQLMLDMGLKLFGFNLNNDPKFVRSNKPFSFNLPILGPCSVIIKSTLRYDENLPLKEDYDFFLQNVEQFGAAIRLNQVVYVCDHQKMKGGCQDYRTNKKEKDNMELLLKKWGSEVVHAKSDDINPIIRV